MQNREATAPGWGAIRDGAIATVTTAVGAWVLSKTGSADLAQSAQDFAGGLANLVLGAAVGGGVFLRKWAADRLHEA